MELKMELTFTRSGDRTYTTMARRNDGVLMHVPNHDRPSSLPHDIAHFVVERELGLDRGFWGRVAAGAMCGGMRVLAGRLPPHANSKSRTVIKEPEQQLIEAEVLVSLLLEITAAQSESDWARVRVILDRAWKPRKSSREALSHSEVMSVCAALRLAQQRWQSLPIGGSIVGKWGPGGR
jgi:hypothetical protein